MRELKDHIVEGDLPQNQLKIEVIGKPGAGGASHMYLITGFNPATNPSRGFDEPDYCAVLFQNGPILEVGVNGITQEVLLAIVIDRLRSFQEGPFPSVPNGIALSHCVQALSYLQERTRDRLSRGVEGTTKV